MTRRPQIARSGALILPLLLVNSAAVYGQAGWAHDHLTPHWGIAALFAASIESIGIYLAYEAHSALMAGDASARLRLGSYLVGMLAGTLNFAHFAGENYHPNPLAVTFGVLSSISPWLWAIRSRSMNRDRLRELGQIDPRAVRFSLLRWAMFPVRTFQAFRGAVWSGTTTPAEAVSAADARRAERKAPLKATATIEPVTVSAITQAPALVADIEPDIDPDDGDLDALRMAIFDEPILTREVSDTTADTDSQDDQPRRRRRQLTTAERIDRLRKRQPDLPIKDIAAKVGVSERTVSRYLNPPGAKAEDVSFREPVTSDVAPVNGSAVSS